MKKLLLLAGVCTLALSASAQNTFPSSGNVGINTLSPSASLHVSGSNREIRVDYDGSNSYYSSLRWSGLQLGNNGSNKIIAGRTGINGWLDFYVNNTNDAADYGNTPDGLLAMRISANGNIGIGTSSPLSPYKLDIRGNILTTGLIGHLHSDGSANYGLIRGNDDGRTTIGDSQTVHVLINGNVLIGKSSQSNSTYKLDIAGKVRADEIVVNTTGADFVFANDYKLRSLADLKEFIHNNKHLPDIPPAKAMQEEGVGVSELQTRLLQKVEELTLYILQQEERLNSQQKQIEQLKDRLEHSRKK